MWFDDYYQLEVTPACPGGQLYTIKAGDTFYLLATRYGITLAAIQAANPGVNPSRLQIGQVICIPAAPTPVLIPTPLCSLLQPVFANLPPTGDIPIGGVIVRQVAMSTRAYTIAASPLPEPAVLGNFNAYLGVLSLITDDPAHSPALITFRLMPSYFGNQLPTWAGTVITTQPPIRGDFAEVRPFNTTSSAQGPILLRGDLAPCQA